MRKIINFILSAAFAVSLVSCDLDKESPDSLPYDKAFQNLQGIQALERGAMSRLRTAFSPSCMMVPDIQSDYLNPINGFSNTYGTIYMWNFTHDDNDVANTWSDFYGVIGFCNFILDGLVDGKGLLFSPTEAEKKSLDVIKGRAYLMRALSYSMLAERFCPDYDAATADKEYSGLPLLLTHDPKAKGSRSTLAKVYETILEDMGSATTLLHSEKGVSDATTLNADCVAALEARVYLQMDNYAKAYERAMSLIGSPAYSLVTSEQELKEMWTYDRSREIIFKFYASKTELAYAWATSFAQDNFNGMEQFVLMVPDYIPSKACLNAYENSDWRKTAYFTQCVYAPTDPTAPNNPVALVKGEEMIAQDMTILSKYPGNPDLRTSKAWNYYNTYKVFRLAEMYLIAAEAAAQDPSVVTNSAKDAKGLLNTLRRQRGVGDLDAVTLTDVQQERYREMIMEGTRLTDLKRWGIGFERGAAQSGAMYDDYGVKHNGNDYVNKLALNLRVTADDYMFLWPIPATEVFANQQLEKQQNPGWER